uniref:Ras and Rab interactor 2 n=1 Tax=Astyanax mexicanus TaxID=7994 RepID=W5L0Y6_ASTMX
MTMNTGSLSCQMYRTGSFLKLVDEFASELDQLEQEMIDEALQKSNTEPEESLILEVEGEVNGVYLQFPLIERSSVSRNMSVLDRLTLTHPIWLLLSITEQEATQILLKQPAGVFLVWRSSELQRKVLSLRVDSSPGPPIIQYPVKESLYTFSLEDAGISFADLFHLVAFYCISRDVLPLTLKLPESISSAKTPTELKTLARLGAGFWDSGTHSCSLVQNKFFSSLHCEQLVTRTHSHNLSGCRDLPSQECSPPELSRACSGGEHKDCSGSREALSFFNPLFLQTHQRLAWKTTTTTSTDSCKDILKPKSEEALSKSRPVPPPRPPPPHLPPAYPLPQKRMPMIATSAKSSLSTVPRLEITGCMVSKHKTSKKLHVPQNQQDIIDNHRCSFALDETNIARALSQYKQSSKAPPRCTSDISKSQDGKKQPRHGLSDSSSSSSDSLDALPYPHQSTRPLSPTQGLSTANSSDEEEEDDYGTGLQRRLQLRLQASQHSKKILAVGSEESHQRSLLIMPRALKGRFRKVRGILGVLATPERRAIRHIIEMSRDKSSYFGNLVQDYMSFVQENHSCHRSSLDLLQTIRQFMTQMKAYLTQSSEMNPPVQSLIPEEQIDAVLERAMHKCLLKPLHGSLDAALHEFQVSNGEWQRLQENLTLARAKKPRELGVNGAQPPDHHAIKKIRRKLHSMCKMYSPERKVMALLHICKLVYTIMLNHSGRTFGADEFLPMLTYVLVQCDMPQLDTEVQYMMELLDPSLLHGEGGYYLTTAYGAMSLIKNYKEEQAACFLRSTTRNTLHQWHQRRTTQKNLPSVEDFQNYLRVALQEADSGCTAKTLQVRPSTTTEEVCRLCAHKFHVIDPENYGLFLLTDDSSQQLAPDTSPQWIKAEFHSQTHTRPFYFVYRRLPNVNDSVL